MVLRGRSTGCWRWRRPGKSIWRTCQSGPSSRRSQLQWKQLSLVGLTAARRSWGAGAAGWSWRRLWPSFARGYCCRATHPRPRRRRTKPRRCGVGSSAGRSYARLQIGSSAGRILDATCSAGAQGNATTVATGSTTSPNCCEPAWLRCVCRRSRRMSDPERAGRVLLSRPGPRSPPRCFWRVSVGFRAVAAQASARGGASGVRRRYLWRHLAEVAPVSRSREPFVNPSLS